MGSLPGLLLAAVPILGCTPDAAPAPSVARLDLGEGSLTIGRLEGAADEVLGSVADIVVDDEGRIWVLDGQAVRLRVYDAEGRVVAAAGGEGDGPGEFRFPSALALSHEGTVLVLSEAHTRLAEFRWAGGAVELVGTPPLPLTARDVCELRGRRFVLGHRDGFTVHEISRDGRILNSFAEPGAIPILGPAGEAEGLGADLAEIAAFGQIVCDEESGTLTLVPAQLPTITTWSPEGELLREATLEPWAQIHVEPTGRGYRMALDPGSGRVTSLASAARLEGSKVLIQTVDRWPEMDPAEGVVTSHLLDLATGALLRAPPGLPEVVFHRDGVAYTRRELPFPRVGVRPLEVEG